MKYNSHERARRLDVNVKRASHECARRLDVNVKRARRLDVNVKRARHGRANGVERRGLLRTSMIATVLLTLGVLVALPMLLMFAISFTSHTPTEFYALPLTLSSYGDVFSAVFASVLRSSVGMSAATTLATFSVAFPFALSLAILPPRRRLVVILLLILPFWVSTIMKVFAFQVILSSNGVVNAVLLYLGVIQEPLQILYTTFAAVLGMVYVLLPFMLLPIYNAVRKIPEECYLAARDLGASPIRILLTITLPLSRSGILAGVLMVFPPSLTMFYVSDILGGSKTLLLGGFIRNQYTVAGNWGYGSAINVVFMVFLVVLTLAVAAVARGKVRHGKASRGKAQYGGV